MKPYIPVNEPLLRGNEKKYLIECIESGWISSEGPFIKAFEEKFAKQVNRKYAIAVANGTLALDIAIESLKIGEGDEVIVPTFTIISCVNQIVRSGAIPVLVDCDMSTWNINVEQIEKRITKKTKAIMAVHIYGLPVDMNPILSLAKKYNLAVLEDSAEAIGQTYFGKPCGSFGRISTFSFYSNKHITTGEGGMIVTDDEVLAEACRSLRNLCFSSERRFKHHRLGWNARMTNMQAAVGLAQLEELDWAIRKKRQIGDTYNSLLLAKGLDLQLPIQKLPYSENIYWVYALLLKDYFSIDAAEVIKRLDAAGVGCRPFFWPIHMQPILKEKGLFANQNFPNSERIADKGFYIPSGLALTESDQERVVDVLEKVIREL